MEQKGKSYGDSITNQIIQINELLTKARKGGIQMKQLAEAVNVSPSVLSAFYRTVIPAFKDSITKMKSEEALEYSFSLVNNISKSRFIPFLPNIILAVEEIMQQGLSEVKCDDKRFFNNFIQTVQNSQNTTHNIEGTYMTYSISSSEKSMKCEPMIISRTSSSMIKVSRLSTHNIIQEGFGIVADHQSLTIILNEAKYPKYYPLTMQINIPMCFNPKIYRGVFMALDASSHPIARRMILHRLSDRASSSELQLVKAELLSQADITPELMDYFEYLSDRNDLLRVSVIPEPTADVRDLKIEKKILKLYEDL